MNRKDDHFFWFWIPFKTKNSTTLKNFLVVFQNFCVERLKNTTPLSNKAPPSNKAPLLERGWKIKPHYLNVYSTTNKTISFIQQHGFFIIDIFKIDFIAFFDSSILIVVQAISRFLLSTHFTKNVESLDADRSLWLETCDFIVARSVGWSCESARWKKREIIWSLINIPAFKRLQDCFFRDFLPSSVDPVQHNFKRRSFRIAAFCKFFMRVVCHPDVVVVSNMSLVWFVPADIRRLKAEISEIQ